MMKPVTSPSLSDVTSVQTGAGHSMAVFARSADDSGLAAPPPLYSHVSVRAGLAAGQGSALGRGGAALAHLAAKVVPLVPHGAPQRAVPGQVGAGVV